MARARARSGRARVGLICGTVTTVEEAALASTEECSCPERDSERKRPVDGPPALCASPCLLDQGLGILHRSRGRRRSGDGWARGCCNRHLIKLVLVAP